MESPLIIALYGGPGTGKSTTAALLFGRLKQLGINVEYVPEVAKDLTWEERHVALSHQPYLICKQLRNYDRLNGKVNVIITDTSPLLTKIYMTIDDEVSQKFVEYIEADWYSRNVLNIFIERQSDRGYNPIGRNQTEEEAVALDSQIEKLVRQTPRWHIVSMDKESNSHVDAIHEEIDILLGE